VSVAVVILCGGLLLPEVGAYGRGAEGSEQATLFSQTDTSAWWLSGQLNVIWQAHLAFRARYTGTNSLKAEREDATSRVVTVYTGVEASRTTEIVAVAESAGGHGLSGGLGLLGAANADVVRNPELGATPYLARFLLRKIVPLTDEEVTQERSPFGLHTRLPECRSWIRPAEGRPYLNRLERRPSPHQLDPCRVRQHRDLLRSPTSRF
jgi:high affinity Mn2+ porin